ncbi:MAG TPA: bifunctional pyr operon transcriptional regulator/uracil phosphoribosyltransferase PyrR [Polyangiaceae bacterium]|nr:bifunctional pyr operon transcriptional regulator/uracil phosphoribosyltransferase PyrR [Polyangiaceae bacterium]
MRSLLDPEDALRGLRRVAGEILERNRGATDLLLVGIRRGGIPVAEELARGIEALDGHAPPVGSVDITLYRDDASTALLTPSVGPTRLPLSLEGRTVVLCDDVLFTGRTIRAAVDALLDYGRPAKVELAVLVDRGGRELPIQADYLVKRVEVTASERVDVQLSGPQLFAAVAVPFDHPTLPPPPASPASEVP